MLITRDVHFDILRKEKIKCETSSIIPRCDAHDTQRRVVLLFNTANISNMAVEIRKSASNFARYRHGGGTIPVAPICTFVHSRTINNKLHDRVLCCYLVLRRVNVRAKVKGKCARVYHDSNWTRRDATRRLWVRRVRVRSRNVSSTIEKKIAWKTSVW